MQKARYNNFFFTQDIAIASPVTSDKNYMDFAMNKRNYIALDVERCIIVAQNIKQNTEATQETM